MQSAVAIGMPGPFEWIILVGMIVIPLAAVFAVVYLAAKLATKNKDRGEPPRE